MAELLRRAASDQGIGGYSYGQVNAPSPEYTLLEEVQFELAQTLSPGRGDAKLQTLRYLLGDSAEQLWVPESQRVAADQALAHRGFTVRAA